MTITTLYIYDRVAPIWLLSYHLFIIRLHFMTITTKYISDRVAFYDNYYKKYL